MAVSIINSSAASYDDSIHITFEESDGVYWFLRPIIGEIWDATGWLIDPFESGSCPPEHLHKLLKLLASSRARIQSEMPDVWNQKTVTEMLPSQKDIEVEATKAEVIAVLDKLSSLSTMCLENGDTLVSQGD